MIKLMALRNIKISKAYIWVCLWCCVQRRFTKGQYLSCVVKQDLTTRKLDGMIWLAENRYARVLFLSFLSECDHYILSTMVDFYLKHCEPKVSLSFGELFHLAFLS